MKIVLKYSLKIKFLVLAYLNYTSNKISKWARHITNNFMGLHGKNCHLNYFAFWLLAYTYDMIIIFILVSYQMLLHTFFLQIRNVRNISIIICKYNCKNYFTVDWMITLHWRRPTANWVMEDHRTSGYYIRHLPE